MRWLFTDPDKFHSGRTIAQITEEAAGKFAALAQSLNSRGHAQQAVAHFLNQCLFCLFAEDAELLPGNLDAEALGLQRQITIECSTMAPFDWEQSITQPA